MTSHDIIRDLPLLRISRIALASAASRSIGLLHFGLAFSGGQHEHRHFFVLVAYLQLETISQKTLQHQLYRFRGSFRGRLRNNIEAFGVDPARSALDLNGVHAIGLAD